MEGRVISRTADLPGQHTPPTPSSAPSARRATPLRLGLRAVRVTRPRAGLVVGPLLALAAYVAVPDVSVAEGSPRSAAITAATLVLMGTWWMTEALPLAVTALVPLVVFPLTGVADVSDVAAPYANKVVFLFLGGFMLAIGMQRWNVHLRIALRIVATVGTRPTRLVLGFMLATAALSMWVSNTATAVMMVPIGASVLAMLGRRGPVDPRLSASLILGIAYAATIGSFGTIIGSPPNALLVGYLSETHGIDIGFGQWMMVGLPLSAVFLLIAWFVLTRIVFRVEAPARGADDSNEGGDAEIRAELDRLGPMGAPQRRVVTVFMVTAAAWVLVPILAPGTQLSDEVIAVLATMALFLIPSGASEGGRLLTWPDTRELPWGILVLFGGGLALASQISSSGLSTWLGGHAHSLGSLPPILVVAAICMLTIAATEFMSNTATAATFLPIMGGVAVTLGLDPLLLTMPVALAAACTFMMPAATPPNAIAYASGHVGIPDLVRGGAPLSAMSVVLVTLTVYVMGGLVFGLVL